MKHLIARLIVALSIIISAPPAHAFDEREVQMRIVLEKYGSPMLGLEKELIEAATNHGLDWTLMAAIAGTESSFGKRMPYNCVNPYGWGIYPGSRICFESFPDAAQKVAKALSERYNTTSLATIARTYNKVSTDSWLAHTQFFVNKIKNQQIPVSQLPITL